MSRPEPRAVLIAVVALAALALTAGCAGFPQRGPVVQGRKIDPGSAGLPRFENPPVRGAAADDIVRGFLRAGSDVREDHKVAREFLTSPQTTWRPEDGVVVTGANPDVTILSGTSTSASSRVPLRDGEVATVRVSGPVVARVDAAGLMSHPDAAEQTFDYRYTLTTEHGQWRISRAAAGLVLTDVEFQDTFQAVPLYFGDAGGHVLVPDVRWFPVLNLPDLTTAATVAVKTLLAGPARWLGRVAVAGGGAAGAAPAQGVAVSTGAPPGTLLTAVGGVQVEGDTAHVDLTRTVLGASPQQRLLLRAQLLATLQGLGGISDVVLTSDPAALAVPDGTGPLPWSPQAPTAPAQPGRPQADAVRLDQPLCLTARSMVGDLDRNAQGRLTCVERKDLAGLSRPDLALPTRNAEGTVFAGLAAHATRIVATAPGGQAQTALTGTALTAASIDAAGWIWSAPGGGGGTVLAGHIGSRPRRISVPWLAGARVKALRISPDGARALVLVTLGTSTQALVAGVERDRSGAPLALADEPLRLFGDLTAGVDAGWSSDDDVVVLASRRGAKGLYAWQAQVGGEATQVLQAPAPRSATGLAVGQTIDVYIRTADGRAVVSSIGSWQPLDVRDLTLPS